MTITYEVIQDTVLTGTTSIGIGASAEVTIRNAASGALVTLFEDRLGASGETNPFNADANGQFRVYTLPGRLQISITFESVTRIWEDFRLGIKTPKLASGDAGRILQVNIDEDGYELGNLSSAANLLANGSLDIWQQGESFDSTTTPANSDDEYMADQVILLSDGNDRVDVSKEITVIPTGAAAAIKLEVETVSGTSEKFGLMFPIESVDALKAAGQNVSLSFKARTTSLAVENLRAAVLSWDGAADVLTSDLVSAWNAEGSDITPVANWTIENTPANLALTNAFQKFKDEGIAIDTASMKNLAVFIWADDTDLVAGDLIYISNVKLEIGNKATAYHAPDFASEFSRCKLYLERITSSVASMQFGTGTSPSAVIGDIFIPITEKRATPIYTVGPNSNGSDFKVINAGGTAFDVTAFAPNVSGFITGKTGLSGRFTVASGLTAGNICGLADDGGNTAFVQADARL